jgi:beta-xylosidase
MSNDFASFGLTDKIAIVTAASQGIGRDILSDEASAPGLPNFTGAFLGVACRDVSGAARHTDFDYFVYHERPYSVAPDAAILAGTRERT